LAAEKPSRESPTGMCPAEHSIEGRKKSSVVTLPHLQSISQSPELKARVHVLGEPESGCFLRA